MLDRYADKLSSFSLHSTSTLWFEDLAGLSTAGANCGLGPSPRLGVKRQDDFFSDKPVLSNKCRFLERPRSPVRPCEDAPSRVATAVIDAAEQPNRISPDPFLSPTHFLPTFGGSESEACWNATATAHGRSHCSGGCCKDPREAGQQGGLEQKCLPLSSPIFFFAVMPKRRWDFSSFCLRCMSPFCTGHC